MSVVTLCNFCIGLLLFFNIDTVDNRAKIQTILQRAAPTLRNQLNVDKAFTRKLAASEVLTDEERAIIDDIHIMHQRVDKLLDTMTRKPVTAYHSFMEILLTVDDGLYNAVKSSEQEVFQGA